MNNKDFNLVCNKFYERIENCKNHFSILEDINDLEDLSLKKLKELISFSKEEYTDQSHILMIDLYHILGMGNLTVTQTSTLIKLMKEYASYRPILNKLGKSELNLNDLPDIKNYEKTCCILTRFDKLKLGYADGVEMKESLKEDTTFSEHTVKVSKNKLPYTYFNKQTGEIRYNREDAKELANFLIKNAKLFSDFKPSSLESKLMETGSYGFYNFFVGEKDGIGYLSTKDETTSLECLLNKMNIPEKLN